MRRPVLSITFHVLASMGFDGGGKRIVDKQKGGEHGDGPPLPMNRADAIERTKLSEVMKKHSFQHSVMPSNPMAG